MNNFSFSKNTFANNAQMDTKIAGNMLNNYSHDGGRRSIEEIRSDQLKAARKNNPNGDKEFQAEIKKNQYEVKLSSVKISNYSSSPNTGQVTQPPVNPDLQTDLARSRMQNFNNRGF